VRSVQNAAFSRGANLTAVKDAAADGSHDGCLNIPAIFQENRT